MRRILEASIDKKNCSNPKRKGFHRTFVKDRVGKKSSVDRPNEEMPLESSRVATRQPEYVTGTASVESLGT